MPSIAEAQRKAGNKAFEGLGTARTSVRLSTLESMLALYAEEFIKTAQENLNKNNSVASGTLSDSIEFRINYMGTDYNLQLLAADYYDFVNKGVQGAGSSSKNNTSPYKFKYLMGTGKRKGSKVKKRSTMIEAIEKWIIRNRLVATASDVSKYGATKRESKAIPAAQGRRTLAFLLARAIKRDGLKATGFWDDAFNSTFRDFGQKMAEALGVDLSIDLKNIAQGLNKN